MKRQPHHAFDPDKLTDESNPPVRIRRSPADKWFSLCVRERAQWTCESCGRLLGENAQNLHASHIFSRRNQATRYDPLNVAAHCFTCHQRLGENPLEFAAWARKHLGDEGYERLTARARMIMKRSRVELGEIADHYRREYQRMRKQRDDGLRGYLEFTAYD